MWPVFGPRPLLASGTSLLAVAVALSALVHLNALHNPFVFDDRTEVVENPSIRALPDLRAVLTHNITRPVTNLSYAIDYQLWGPEPFGFHLTNLLLHSVNTWLLFTLVRRLATDFVPLERGDPAAAIGAFLAAGLFAVHPLMTSAVGYVSGRAEVLVAALVLGASHCFWSALHAVSTRAWVAFALGGLALFTLGLGTKETAVMLPPVLVLLDRLRPPRTGRRWHWELHVPLLLIVLALALARAGLYVGVEQPLEAGFNPYHLLLNLHVFQQYLTLLVFPVSQSIAPEVVLFESLADPRLISAVAILGGLVAVAIVMRKRQPLTTIGVAWWFLMLVPSSVLVLLAERGQPMAEHRVYLASCGFFIACAGVALGSLSHGRFRFRRPLQIAVPAAVLAALSILTIARNQVWSDPVRLWSDAARKSPNTWVAHQGLASAYASEGDCESAVAAYERAIALRPEISAAYLGLAQCLSDLGRMREARHRLLDAVKNAPLEARPRLALASMEEQVFRRFDEALRLCREALLLQADHPQALQCVERNRARASPAIR